MVLGEAGAGEPKVNCGNISPSDVGGRVSSIAEIGLRPVALEKEDGAEDDMAGPLAGN